MDGSRTDRSEMAGRIARWVAAPEQEALWRSRPVRGQVGILVLPETQQFLYALNGDSAYYARSVEGAYRGFFDINVQADWVRIEDIDDYAVLYLPIPAMMTADTADALRAWVAAGGTLISEGCPGYFGDRGHVGTVQPNLGLADLFGAREAYVEFTPDLLNDLSFHIAGATAWGGVFLQTYAVTTGQAMGWFSPGCGRASEQVAVVDNAWGAGRTLLMGTMAGYGHGAHAQRDARPDAGSCETGGNTALYRALASWAGVVPDVTVSDPCVIARLHAGEGGTYLWVANPTRAPRSVAVSLAPRWQAYREVRSLWGAEASIEAGEVRLVAPARDVTVLALR
jgi:beta-galactosidase